MRAHRIAELDVSRETMDKLAAFSDLVTKWTKTINLVAPNTVPDIWNRHIVDSAQLLQHAPSDWKNWVDLGSGGGLPGIVIAIMMKPKQHVTLIESDTRKSLFLKTARRELDLNITVHAQRIDAVSDVSADVLSARALAPLDSLLGHANSFLNKGGIALFPKGRRHQEELDQAHKNWQFDLQTHQSLTDPEAKILQISRIARREH